MTAPVPETTQSVITPEHEQQHTIEPGVREVDPKNPKLHMIQSRADMDFETVRKYIRMMLDGIVFEPGKAFEDADGNLWGYDGKHRCEACIDATNHVENTSGKKYMLRLEIAPGTKEDAEWAALGANQFHGLPRSERDMERIIREAFLSPKKPSEREVARHTGYSRRQVGNVRKEMQEEGLLDVNYKPVVKRGNQEFEQDNVEKAAKAAATRAQKTSDTPGQIEKQAEIPGTEQYYSVDELVGIVRQHLTGDRKERESYLHNISENTVATGRAYIREIEEGLKAEPGKSWCKANIRAAARVLLRELQQFTCSGCGFSGKNSQMFQHGEKWYCSKCYREIEEKQLRESMRDPELPNVDASVIDNLILEKLQHLTKDDLRAQALHDAILNVHDALDILAEMIPGYPKQAIKQRCAVLYNQLSQKIQAAPQKELEKLKELEASGQKRESSETSEIASKQAEKLKSAGITPMLSVAEEEQALTNFRKNISRVSKEGLEEIQYWVAKELNGRADKAVQDTQKHAPCARCGATVSDVWNDMKDGRVICGQCYYEETMGDTQAFDIKSLCSTCEHHRARSNPKHGKLLGDYYHGKCIREGGLCDEVQALMAEAGKS